MIASARIKAHCRAGDSQTTALPLGTAAARALDMQPASRRDTLQARSPLTCSVLTAVSAGLQMTVSQDVRTLNHPPGSKA